MTILILAYKRPQRVASIIDTVCKNLKIEDQIVVSIDDYYSIEDWSTLELRYKHIKITWIKNESKIGLEKHVIKACNYASKLDDFLYLEEDISVSDISLDFVRTVQKELTQDLKIRQVSLSSIEWNELDNRPFLQNFNGLSFFLAQVSSSWGVFYKKEWWNEFSLYYQNKSIDFPHYKLKEWKHSWKKYHITFLNTKNYYTLYPTEHMAIHEGKDGTNTKGHVKNFYRELSTEFQINQLKETLNNNEKISRFNVNLEKQGSKKVSDALEYTLRSIPLKLILKHLLKRYR